VIPTVLVMLMFWYGWEGYLSLRRIPDDAMHIKATGRMWSWLFSYDNGKTADKLYVPAGQPVKIELVAEDVLHSFYVPAFRVKRDMVPGMINWVWFTAEKPGSFDLFCAEYCGVGHSAMVTTVEALPAAEFQAWLTATAAAENPAARGLELAGQLGCLGCHSVDGSRRVGPTLKGLFGQPRDVVSNGRRATVTADAAYLQRAILEPAADIVDGYPPAMPPFGQLSETELQALLAWMESLH
jgi:cytochrome c oxidase subunit II